MSHDTTNTVHLPHSDGAQSAERRRHADRSDPRGTDVVDEILAASGRPWGDWQDCSVPMPRYELAPRDGAHCGQETTSREDLREIMSDIEVLVVDRERRRLLERSARLDRSISARLDQVANPGVRRLRVIEGGQQ